MAWLQAHELILILLISILDSLLTPSVKLSWDLPRFRRIALHVREGELKMADYETVYNAPTGSQVQKCGSNSDFTWRMEHWIKALPHAHCVKTELKYTSSTTDLHTDLVRQHEKTDIEEASTAGTKTKTSTDLSFSCFFDFVHLWQQNSFLQLHVTWQKLQFYESFWRKCYIYSTDMFNHIVKWLFAFNTASDYIVHPPIEPCESYHNSAELNKTKSFHFNMNRILLPVLRCVSDRLVLERCSPLLFIF